MGLSRAANLNDTWGELDRVPFDSLCRV